MSEAEFWRFNLYIICEMFDHNDERIDYIHKRDVVADSEPYPTEQPADYRVERVVDFGIPECAWARVLIYLIPFALPKQREVEMAPPLPMSVVVTQDGGEVASYVLHANQWSGRRLDFDLPLNSEREIRGR